MQFLERLIDGALVPSDQLVESRSGSVYPSIQDLERGVFSGTDPARVARSLKRSAQRSRRRKSDPFRSAMSMLTFYIKRAGRKLSKRRL